MFHPFSGCIKGKAKLKIVLKCGCCKYKKIELNINAGEDVLPDILAEIRQIIAKYEKQEP